MVGLLKSGSDPVAWRSCGRGHEEMILGLEVGMEVLKEVNRTALCLQGFSSLHYK
jgi:hypothetical protein